jgi:hypothetical protein
VPLPRQPRLLSGLPVLRRMAGETQIGTQPPHAIVLTYQKPWPGCCTGSTADTPPTS